MLHPFSDLFLQASLPMKLKPCLWKALCLLISTIVLTSGAAAEPPYAMPSPSIIRKFRSARVETSKGEMIFRLFPESAPAHVANFKYLADKGFYRGLLFTQYHEHYLIQGGQPSSQRIGPGWTLPPEFNRHKHLRGSLGMARMPDDINPERRSNGSQFHILLSDAKHMDGNYTVFGQLIAGWNTLDALREGDIIDSVKVYVMDDSSDGE